LCVTKKKQNVTKTSKDGKAVKGSNANITKEKKGGYFQAQLKLL
jgi:hypothetical protein